MTNVTTMCRNTECTFRKSCLWYRAQPEPGQRYYIRDTLIPDDRGVCRQYHHIAFAQGLRTVNEADAANAFVAGRFEN